MQSTRCVECGALRALAEGEAWSTVSCVACENPFRGKPEDALLVLDAREKKAIPSPWLSSGPRRVLVVEDVRSQHNVGSFFRSADGAGWRHLCLCGISPCPPAKGISKTALGAEATISWSYHAASTTAIDALLSEGYRVLALERARDAVDLVAFAATQDAQTPIALLVGNELWGLSPEALRRAHTTLAIPMRGEKRSLNVSVAFGIAAYALSSR